jgi:tetraacyldisaccharide 4'-kinase
VSTALVPPRPWLAPLGILFGRAASLRASLYRRGVWSQARLQGPVISVGNLSVGGSGKTPVVARLARLLQDEGRAVSILSRGYGGSFQGDCLVVSDGRSVVGDAATAGDEPVMLARALPGVVVAVGPHRDVVGRAVEARFGACTHILDDGFQHLRLARDLDVVCVAPRDLADRPLPAGWLREAPAALSRAQVVLLATDGADGEAIQRAELRLGPERTFLMRRRIRGFFSPDGVPRPGPSRAFLLSGIARPERFAADVAEAVPDIVGHDAFRDHHVFTPAQVDAVAARARALGADAIVTTEKDLVRLPVRSDAPPLLVLKIEADIEDEPRFRARILDALRARPS